MIHLINVSKSFAHAGHVKTILEPTSMTLPAKRAIGVLGRNGAGKSTLLRMLAGVERPDDGEILREIQVSWPLGFAGGFHVEMTGRENVVFIARIYGLDPEPLMDFVEDFSELGEYMDRPFRTYSAGMRARLAFAASMAVNFECYLIDEITAVGDSRFQEKCRAEFERRREKAGLIIVSHNVATIRRYCELALVLRDGLLLPFDNVEEAIEMYEAG